MTPNPDSREFMASLVRRLDDDLWALKRGYEFIEAAFHEFRARHELEHLHELIDVEFAAWVLVRFGAGREEFLEYLERVRVQHDRLNTDLFSLGTPDKIEPDLRAESHLDRVDIALNYLANWLKIPLPAELRDAAGSNYSIRNGKWGTQRHLDRALAFVEAARQIFCGEPTGPKD